LLNSRVRGLGGTPIAQRRRPRIAAAVTVVAILCVLSFRARAPSVWARAPGAGQTTAGGVQDPAWSPDGRHLAFSFLDQIWIGDKDGANARPLSPQSAGTERHPAWSPDGKSIAFSEAAGGGFAIVVIGADGGAKQKIGVDREARWPAWTRDGRLLFSQRQDAGWRLYSVALDGRAPVPLFPDADEDDERQPAISPDGKRIAFVSDRESDDGDVDLWMADMAAEPGGRVRRTRLARIRGDEASPSWAPDGLRIAFAAVRDGAPGVWVTTVDPDERPAPGPVLVSRVGGTPAWSPDGRRIAIADLPPAEPAYNGNPVRNHEEPPPLFADAYRLRLVDAPLPVDSGSRSIAPPKPPRGRFTAAFDRVWETLRRLYYADGPGESVWTALKDKYRPAAAAAKDDGELETVVDAMVTEQPLIKPAVTSTRAVVVSGHPLASRAGSDALERGGNIVDAAIAVSFALGVVEPDASGIGGDGMAVLYLKGMSEPVVIDYKDQAPSHATRDNPLLQRAAPDGPAAANIPGVVAGLDYLYRTYASQKITWEDLIAPAIRHAEAGYELDAALPTTIAEGRRYFARHAAAAAIFLPDGRVPQAGQRFVNKDYAATLRAIASEGASAFYRGSVARRIAADMAQHGGLITLDDLAQYRAIERKPVTGQYRDYRLFSASPPVSTGAMLIETLQILQNYPARSGAAYSRDADFLHYAIESWKARDAGPRIADPALWEVSIGPHLDPDHAAALFKRINPSKASRPSPPPGEAGPPERIGRGTTAFAVADADGNMIAVTQTLSTWGGTFYVSSGLGFLYNNHLRLSANSAPGRFLPLARSSSTSVPTLLFKSTGAGPGPGVPALAVAAAGNNWIPASVYNIILNVVDGGMPAQPAIEAPRFLIGRDPSDAGATRVQIEDRIPRAVLQDLIARGHRFQKIGRKGEVRYGYAAAVVVDTGRREVQAGAEPRRSHGAAAVGAAGSQ
jgi:gamma-glutamyltranspeptidase